MMNPDDDKRWWKELAEIAEREDVKGFYRHYAKYLRASGVVSDRRRVLLKMADAVAQLIR